jgi:hypothetical protein
MAMEYGGSETRLRSGEMSAVAKEFGLSEAHARTVVEVETSGKGYDSLGEVAFLFEPHKFYANVKGDKPKLQKAIQQGLAYPSWKGPGSYPKTPALRWQQFQKAAQMYETAAIKSTSWGLGQIMGSEFAECGYDSPQEMLTAFYKSEAEQLRAMFRLIKARKLDRELKNFPQEQACRNFARRYNGALYEKNKYHTKLADAYRRWSARLKQSKEEVIPVEEDRDDTLRVGDYDKTADGPVRKMQQMFEDKGYSLAVDGKFGPGTRATVLAWKGNEGLPLTPDMSPSDIIALMKSGPMPVAEERANATVADLKPKSTIIQQTSLGQKVLGWTGAGTAAVSGLDASGVLDTAQANMDKVSQAKGVFVSVRETLTDLGIADLLVTVAQWKFEILLVSAVVGFFIVRYIQKKRLEMHQKAEVA